MATAALCAILSASLSPHPVAAQQPPEMVYVYPEPSIWGTSNGQSGTVAKLFPLAQQIFAKMGATWRAEAYPPERLFRTMQDETFMVSLLVQTPRLNDCCLVGSVPVTRARINVYSQKQMPKISQPYELAEKNLILIAGYSYGDLFDLLNDPTTHIHSVTAQSHLAAFEMLLRGRGDYVLDYADAAAQIIEEQKIEDLQSQTIATSDVFLVVNKTRPNAQDFLNRLDRAAQSLVKTPTRNR